MIVFEIAKKNIIEFIRDFKSSAIVVIMPLVMMAVFGFVFKTDMSTVQFSVGYVSKDNSDFSTIIDTLSSMKNSDSDISLFDFSSYDDEESARDAVISNQDVLSLRWDDKGQIVIMGDSRNPYFNAAAGIVSQVVKKHFGIDDSVVSYESLLPKESSSFTGFDMLAPGLMIYGLLILIPHTAGLMTEIREKGLLLRYYLSKASSVDIILGYTLSQMALAILQTILLYYAARFLGFKPTGNPLLALVIAVPTNVFIVGVGLLIGSFVFTSNNASNVGTIISIILGFMSGSFIAGIETIMKIGEIGGRTISFNQIFPSTFATQALSKVLLHGQTLGDIGFELTVLSISSVVVLGVGMHFYRKLQLERMD